MAEHYFLFPFGVNGNLLAVPNPAQVSGTVSYQQGFPIGYEEANTAPGYLSIPRNQFNQLMFDTTSAIQQLQQTGFPSWITSAANGGTSFSYALGAQVWQNGIPYRSLIPNNTDTPPSSNWVVVGQSSTLYFNFAVDTGSANTYVIAPNPALTALAAGVVVQMQPQFANTGACTLQVNGTPATPIKTLQNQDPASGMIIPAGMFQFEYNAVTGCWVLQNPALGTAAYAALGTTNGTLATLNQSNALNGYEVRGPITYQWGYYTSGSLIYNPVITFNVPFSAKAYNVQATAAPPNAGGPAVFTTISNDLVTASQFQAKTFGGDGGAAQAYPFFWYAIGPT